MAPNAASNGVVANGNGVHQNGNTAAHSNGNGTAARPAVAPKSSHEDRWAGVERPYSQVSFTVPTSRNCEWPCLSKGVKLVTPKFLDPGSKAVKALSLGAGMLCILLFLLC